mgnify:CR=1 FL=1|tara:strand:+ start:11197 stop:11784 length:588 start_codon:yes stop_codon:yes gene_type:complete
MYIYYSNHCNKSRELLNFLYKTPFRDKFKYVCIDNRVKQGDQIFILLNNGQRFPLPSQIRKVPTLLNTETNELYVGEQIKHFLVPPAHKIERQNDAINHDPDAFSFGINNGSAFGVKSDSFSYLTQSEQEMRAQGQGGMKQLYNYVTLNSYDQKIETPEEESIDQQRAGSLDLKQIEHERSIDFNSFQKQQNMNM